MSDVRGDKERLALAVGVLFALPGVVSTYYGDEIGMSGEHADHGNRRGMIWDAARQDARLLEIHRRLGRLRRSQPALKVGAYDRLVDDGDLVSFARTSGGERLIVLVNGGGQPRPVRDSPLGRELGRRPRLIDQIAYHDTAVDGAVLPARSVTIYATRSAT